MAAVKAADIDRVLARRPPDANLLLFYGPDAGRVAERARLAARGAVDDPEDSFQLIRLDGDSLADEPGRLVEEASTFGLFGGRRAIWVRPTGRSIVAAVTACLSVSLVDTLVVVEAAELAKSAPLRVACENSARALALPCYADEGKNLGAVIVDTLRAHGLAISPEARELLAESLGGDRLATRSELEKLALYAHGTGTVSLEDVEAAVSDVSGPSFDAAIDAAFLGDRAGLDLALRHLSQSGASAAAILALALRHGLVLLGSVARMASGKNPEALLRSWRGVSPNRRPIVLRQMGAWNTGRLTGAVSALQSAVLTSRRSPAMGDAAATQVLFSVAAKARSGK